MSNLIEIKNLKFSYAIENPESNLSINNLSLTIQKGEFVAVLGKNGSGKSTLAKHLNCLLLPISGDVLVDGMNTKEQSKLWDIRKKVGMIFQNPDNQIVANTVEEDVAFGLENIGYPPEKIKDRVYEALRMVSMYEFRKKSPSMLSGGQKQRVAIAGILAMRPECIVLDEPTAMLDPLGRKEVIDIIKSLNKAEKITAVLITHYMEEAVQADRVIVMEKGVVQRQGTPQEVFSEVEAIKEIGLDVPQVTELAYELRKQGMPIKTDIMTLDEMVMNLCQLL